MTSAGRQYRTNENNSDAYYQNFFHDPQIKFVFFDLNLKCKNRIIPQFCKRRKKYFLHKKERFSGTKIIFERS